MLILQLLEEGDDLEEESELESESDADENDQILSFRKSEIADDDDDDNDHMEVRGASTHMQAVTFRVSFSGTQLQVCRFRLYIIAWSVDLYISSIPVDYAPS